MSRKPKHPRKKPPPYYRQRFLCSAGEWRFCQKLEQAVGDRFVVMMQVSVAALVRVPAEAWERHGVHVAPLRFDFVLVERGTSFAAAAIELDDKTHLLPERRRRDAFLNETCELAGLPLIRVKTAQRYSVAELRETEFAPTPLVNAILAVLEERLDAASTMAESGLAQNPESAEWALVLTADRLLDGRPFDLPEYFGPEVEDSAVRLLRGHGEIARDPREVLATLLARELPDWEIWSYRRLTRTDNLVDDGPWGTLMRSRALIDIGVLNTAERNLRQLTTQHKRFGPGWDAYESLRSRTFPADPWATEMVELRMRRMRTLRDIGGTPLELEVDRAAGMVLEERYAAARGVLRQAIDVAGPDAKLGRDLLARCSAQLGDLSAATSEYLSACEVLPPDTDHPLVAEFLAFLEAPRPRARQLDKEEVGFALERLHKRFPHDPAVSLSQVRALATDDDGPELTLGFASNRLRALRQRVGDRPLDSLRPGAALAWANFLLQIAPESAEQLVREELVRTPGDLELWLMLAECIRANGRTEEALDVYKRLVEMSDDSQAHLSLAWMLSDHGAPPAEVQRHLDASISKGRTASPRTILIQLRALAQSADDGIGSTIAGLTKLWQKRREIQSEVPVSDLGMAYASALISRSTRADEQQLHNVVDELLAESADAYERDTLRGLGALATVVADEVAETSRRRKTARKARKALEAQEVPETGSAATTGSESGDVQNDEEPEREPTASGRE